jgi:hypothetical protein
MKNLYLILLLFLLLGTISCGSAEEPSYDWDEQQAIEEQEEFTEQAQPTEEELETQRIHDEYIDNSLNTGATPYAYCFGKNKSCTTEGCSQIKVTTPYNSDVLVIIKKNDKVYRHAYINGGSSYTFEFPDGTYQIFFYYGKGWYPGKEMKRTTCGLLKGGFVSSESFGKDDSQTLNNSILTYELVLQEGGNFSTSPSDSDEAF